jgi:hypothetical protein
MAAREPIFLGCLTPKQEAALSELARRALVAVEHQVEPDMVLPEGRKCRDCANANHCRWYLGSRWSGENVYCDWSPSRFVARRGI